MGCTPYKHQPGGPRAAEFEAAIRGSRTREDAAKLLGIGIGALDYGARVYGIVFRETLGKPRAVVEAPPSPEVPIGELLEDRIRRWDRKAKHHEARKLIGVKVPDDRPIGVLHFGDPHLDDDGTDLRSLRDHVRLVQTTEGLYAANVGDTTNNWIGRLARLYGAQATTATEAWRLAEWFIGEVGRRWLYIVSGNHDAWSGAGDPLQWIAAQQVALYQSSEVRVALRFQGGLEVRINCRHDFDGHSMWNPAHGPMKAVSLGTRDHLAVAGHRHVSAYGLLKDPDSGITMHALRVGSYKRHDRYALEKGLRDQTVSPCALTTIDPRLAPTHPDLVKVWWDPFEGAEFLTWARRRHGAAARPRRRAP